MICYSHQKPISFLCKSSQCAYLPLCSDCRSSHISNNSANHDFQLLTLNEGLVQAQGNLDKQFKAINELMSPLQIRKEIVRQIEEQKQQLLNEKSRALASIAKQFDEQIAELNKLNKNNPDLTGNQAIEGLNSKLVEISELKKSLKTNAEALRRSLNYNSDSFIYNLNRESLTQLTKSNTFKMYEGVKRQYGLPRLRFKETTARGMPLKQLLNQSPLYFLIDQSANTSHSLHYFHNNRLHIYDIKCEKWQEIFSKENLPIDAESLYEPSMSRYYLIGGQINGIPSEKIIWFDYNLKFWGSARIQIPRTCAMAVPIQSNGYIQILIVGGTNRRQILKRCEIFDQRQLISVSHSNTNFATALGTLVNLGNRMVFKIGGANKFGQTDSLVEIIEKLQYDETLKAWSQVWRYIELELPGSGPSKQLFALNQAAIQINPNEIFVFGGCNQNKQGINDSFIIEVESFKNDNLSRSAVETGYRYYARWVNQKPLISRDHFQCLKPIVWDGSIYSLQHRSRDKAEKRLLQFNMHEWIQTDCVVEK